MVIHRNLLKTLLFVDKPVENPVQNLVDSYGMLKLLSRLFFTGYC